jgi:hypothetical protein
VNGGWDRRRHVNGGKWWMGSEAGGSDAARAMRIVAMARNSGWDRRFPVRVFRARGPGVAMARNSGWDRRERRWDRRSQAAATSGSHQ